ncbi:hypothetical protein ACFLZN_02685, partial [Nanoarchaeota archaeon]
VGVYAACPGGTVPFQSNDVLGPDFQGDWFEIGNAFSNSNFCKFKCPEPDVCVEEPDGCAKCEIKTGNTFCDPVKGFPTESDCRVFCGGKGQKCVDKGVNAEPCRYGCEGNLPGGFDCDWFKNEFEGIQPGSGSWPYYESQTQCENIHQVCISRSVIYTQGEYVDCWFPADTESAQDQIPKGDTSTCEAAGEAKGEEWFDNIVYGTQICSERGKNPGLFGHPTGSGKSCIKCLDTCESMSKDYPNIIFPEGKCTEEKCVEHRGTGFVCGESVILRDLDFGLLTCETCEKSCSALTGEPYLVWGPDENELKKCPEDCRELGWGHKEFTQKNSKNITFECCACKDVPLDQTAYVMPGYTEGEYAMVNVDGKLDSIPSSGITIISRDDFHAMVV